jgi:hypothetical protein
LTGGLPLPLSSVDAKTEIVLPQNSVTNMSDTGIFRPEKRILLSYFPFPKVSERKYRTRMSAPGFTKTAGIIGPRNKPCGSVRHTLFNRTQSLLEKTP